MACLSGILALAATGILRPRAIEAAYSLPNSSAANFRNAVRASRWPLLKVRVSRFVEGFTHLALDVELRLEIDGSTNERPGAPFGSESLRLV